MWTFSDLGLDVRYAGEPLQYAKLNARWMRKGIL